MVNSHPSALFYQPNQLLGPHGCSTKFKQIQFRRDLITIFLVFAQSNSTQQVHLRIKAEDQHRCLAIVELFVEHIVRCPCLRRVNNNSTSMLSKRDEMSDSYTLCMFRWLSRRRRCQLSTKGFSWSLNVILGYQIRVEVAFFSFSLKYLCETIDAWSYFSV